MSKKNKHKHNGDIMLPEELTAMLGVSIQRVYTMARTGIIPAGVAIHLGRQVRFSRTRLDAWLAAGGQTLPGGWRQNPKRKRAHAA